MEFVACIIFLWDYFNIYFLITVKNKNKKDFSLWQRHKVTGIYKNAVVLGRLSRVKKEQKTYLNTVK